MMEVELSLVEPKPRISSQDSGLTLTTKLNVTSSLYAQLVEWMADPVSLIASSMMATLMLWVRAKDMQRFADAEKGKVYMRVRFSYLLSAPTEAGKELLARPVLG